MQPCPQAFTLKQLRNDIGTIVLPADIEHRQNVGMVERSRCPRFLLKTTQALRITGASGGQNLDRNFPSESQIARPVDFPHSARAERGEDLVWTQLCTDVKCHPPIIIASQDISEFLRRSLAFLEVEERVK